MIAVEKKKVSRTGNASLGWFMGRGFVQEYITVKSEQWCVCENGKVIAECRGEKIAVRIMDALTQISETK